MKKLFAAILLVFALFLTGCNASMGAGGVKSSLEGAGYKVETMNKEEAKARVTGVNYVVSPTDVIYATKGDDLILMFFFNSIDDADAFVKENIGVMHSFAERNTTNPKVGSHNNTAYVGSVAAAKAAGIPTFS